MTHWGYLWGALAPKGSTQGLVVSCTGMPQALDDLQKLVDDNALQMSSSYADWKKMWVQGEVARFCLYTISCLDKGAEKLVTYKPAKMREDISGEMARWDVKMKTHGALKALPQLLVAKLNKVVLG